MSKNKKISLILISTILILFMLAVTIMAKITGKSLKNNTGTYGGIYTDAIVKNISKIKWDNVKDKYYHMGTANDYQQNVLGKYKNRLMCLNHFAGDGASNETVLVVEGIIDIDGGYVKVQGPISNSNSQSSEAYVGESAAILARMAYEKYNQTSNGKTWADIFTYNYGWAKFLQSAKEGNVIGDTKDVGNSVYSTSFYNKDLTTLFKAKCYDINMVVTKQGKQEIIHENGKTIIKGYNISNYQNGTKKTVKLTTKTNKEYYGTYDYTNKQFIFKANITDEIKNIQVTQSYTGYKARLIALGSNGGQARLVSCGTKKEIKKTITIEEFPPQNVDVSLQKYIIKLNDKDLTSSSTSLQNRKNTKANSTITSNPSKNNKATNNYKVDKPVNIEPGDKVTYRITVYNNSNVTANSIKIKDDFLYYYNGSNKQKYTSDYYDINGAKKDGTNISTDWIENGTEYEIKDLAGGKSTDIDITVTFNEYINKKIGNYAYINNTTPTNNTKYRIKDNDYVKMGTYAVSLEKYISKVKSNGKDKILASDNRYDILKQYLSGSDSNALNRWKTLKNMSDIDKNGTIDAEDLALMEQYIEEQSNINIDSNKVNKNIEYIKNYLNADVNKDGIIDDEDIHIYESIGSISKIENIEQYIKLDINKDGVLNNNDKIIYQSTLSDINKDGVLDIYDKYLAFIYENEFKIDNEDSTKLDLQKLKKYIINKNNENERTIQNYIISDVNQDGVVDEYDYKFWNAYCVEIFNNISNKNLNDQKITNIENVIKNYDKNEDEKVNERDIEAINSNAELTQTQKDEIISLVRQYIANREYDIDGNNSIEYVELNYEITYEDEAKTSISKVESYITGDALILDISNRLIENNMTTFAGQPHIMLLDNIVKNCKDNNDKYYLYDINTDGIITQEDLTKYNNTVALNNIQISNITDINNFVQYLDDYFKEFGNIDYNKLKNISEFYNETITEDVDINIEEIENSSKEEISKRDLNNDGFVDYRDVDIYSNYLSLKNSPKNYINDYTGEYLNYIVELELTEEEKQLLLSNSSNINISNIDINKDGFINQEDIDLINQYYGEEYIENCKNTSADIMRALMSCDVNGDEVFDKSDYDIIMSSSNVVDLTGDGKVDSNDMKLLKEIIIYQNIDDNTILNIKNSSTATDYNNRAGKAEYLTETNGKYVDKTKNDSQWTQHNQYKYNNIVTVSKGDTVTYTIKVKNDGTTSVYIPSITDYLPDGVAYNGKSYNGGKYNQTTGNKVIFTNLENKLLAPGESASFEVTVEVIEHNTSLNVLKNTAEITNNTIKNKNKIEIIDTTPNNNKDSDYIQLNYKDGQSIIAGKVWNDKALDKTGENYNALYDEGKENGLKGIKVYLYRDGVAKNIATTTTDENGNYSFCDNDIDASVITNAWERYIKGPRNKDNNRWAGSYYSYYVVFEYDGVTYTSTPDGTTYKDITDAENYKINSNAREDFGKSGTKRTEFNNRFKTINNESGIEYKTKNENGYIPQSNYKYNPATMTIKSSTNKITLSNDANLEEKLQYINLGLRGRDIFDLELTSDVYSTKVTVNGVDGEYNYNSNRVTVRKADINVAEDAANFASEAREGSISEVNQNIRKTDIKNDVYGNTGLGIEVTYKITITNASKTPGTATKVTDYYDSRYTFDRAYSGNNKLQATTEKGGNGYNSVVITTPGANLTQSQAMDIYVVYKLNSATITLKDLLNGTKVIPTYNMAEITEYKTTAAKGQTEYTRGLLDKDSAPGSADKEQVRTTETEGNATPTKGGNPTTVDYYFSKINNSSVDLTKLKYEDDTYAAPTLYFGSSDSARTIKGKVFEDKTTLDSNKVKSGNGKYDNGENVIKGATVKLVEITKDGEKIRYTVTSNKDGYTISGFLPGNYKLVYSYGDKKETFYVGDNGTSYNGADFQSTNNSKLNTRDNYWYIDNEKDEISVAKDSKNRREEISKNVTNFTDSQMNILNEVRNKNKPEGSDKIADATRMTSATTNKNMKFEVEKPSIENNAVKSNSSFAEYTISNMNFGIAKVPVTDVTLTKEISSFKILDSAGQNVIAEATYDSNKKQWNAVKVGDVITLENNGADISVEDEKLQGAKLQVTYKITSNINKEKNFDDSVVTISKISGIVDFIDNNLSYNAELNGNSNNWEVTNYEDVKKAITSDINKQSINNYENRINGGTFAQINPDGKKYNTIVKAKDNNAILNGGETTITLEKVLSSTDSTIEQIVTSTTEIFDYSNKIEITGLEFEGATSEKYIYKDRIRRVKTEADVGGKGYVILPGIQHDYATSGTITIHPPTGDSNVNITYYVIAIVSLVVLAGGTFGIKKFVVKSKKK